MPSDMPPQQIVEALQDLGITLNDCKVMTNRKTGLPMPLFLLSLPRNETNRDIYNITEICYMKIVVGSQAQEWPCTVLPLSRVLPQFPILYPQSQMRQVRETASDPGLQKDPRHGRNLLPLPGQPPSKLLRMPDESIKQASTPSQSQRLAGREKEKKRRARSQKNPSTRRQYHDNTSSSIPQPAEPPTRPTETRTSPPTANASTPTPTTQPLKIPRFSEPSRSSRTLKTDRRTHRGGGTAILIKNSIEHNSIKIHTDAVETAAIEIIGPNLKFTICSIYKPPSASTPNFIQDLKKIFRNRNQCLVVGDFNAKHRSWNPHPQHCSGNALFKFARNNSLVISAPSDPTIIPAQQNRQPAIIDLGLSRGLNNITVESRYDLTSDHNPVHFVVHFNFNNSHIPNCKSITNWNKYQDILSTTIAGNPPINNTEDIEHAIEKFQYQHSYRNKPVK
ncbi:putative RNA-directed DNA polymerase from transposon X-element [Trichonephila clavipes]|nr:putative RNA-directed DNA polymerase from transposon X-element [Trichonephila clavipes]